MKFAIKLVDEITRAEMIDYCIRIDKVFNRLSKDYENMLDDELDKCYTKSVIDLHDLLND
ncbi:hypothetical protein FP76_gp125 [Bacillus phage Evoli]|uniref:Uncharacterized protein n=1 Tax=Bacillus phage Evoli TaxID=1486658 RepID=A0A024B012_9CAUD|nr:hypothetical protein FP76_gp125 [Bacillus phage Evoli]AHZ09969.1 hypothetical protein [Bacillus phage Evoli]